MTATGRRPVPAREEPKIRSHLTILCTLTTAALLAAPAAGSTGARGFELGKWSPGAGNAVNAIYFVWCGNRYRWCPEGAQAVRVAHCETGGTYSKWATNGQYLGLFQMGSYARARYGHSWDPWGQARAAHRYWRDAGWRPWECAYIVGII